MRKGSERTSGSVSRCGNDSSSPCVDLVHSDGLSSGSREKNAEFSIFGFFLSLP
jgi:hypothetical protein